MRQLDAAPRRDAAAEAVAPHAFDYLNPALPAGLRRVAMHVVDAAPDTLQGYGELIDDPHRRAIEIVRWPAQGTRPVDTDTGDQGGTTQGADGGRVNDCPTRRAFGQSGYIVL